MFNNFQLLTPSNPDVFLKRLFNPLSIQMGAKDTSNYRDPSNTDNRKSMPRVQRAPRRLCR